MPDAPGPAGRLLSLDVFRGLTVAGMLLVNTPGSWSAVYPPLRHAEWHGLTAADLVFPFFLFIVGITTVLSLEARRARGASDGALARQVLRRAALIVLFGVALGAFPFFTWGEVAGRADPTFLQRVLDRPLHTRLPGVLQRIGLAYGVAALLVLGLRPRARLAAAAGILLGYWALLTLVPVPGTGLPGWRTLDDPGLTLAAWVDRALFDWGAWGNHLWTGSRSWDPEGLLGTIPSVASVLLGAQAGCWLRSPRPMAERLNLLFAAGALAAMLGVVWGWAFPVNKNLWTSSYVVLTSGLAALAFATISWMVDVRGWRGWTYPAVVFGVNPIVAFVGSGAMARLLYSVLTVPAADGSRVPLQAAIFRAWFAPLGSPAFASLLFAVAFVAFWFVVLAALHQRGLHLKV